MLGQLINKSDTSSGHQISNQGTGCLSAYLLESIDLESERDHIAHERISNLEMDDLLEMELQINGNEGTHIKSSPIRTCTAPSLDNNTSSPSMRDPGNMPSSETPEQVEHGVGDELSAYMRRSKLTPNVVGSLKHNSHEIEHDKYQGNSGHKHASHEIEDDKYQGNSGHKHASHEIENDKCQGNSGQRSPKSRRVLSSDSSGCKQVISDEQFQEKKWALVSVMKERFLEGDDKEQIDYNSIDYDESLDDLKQMEVDAQEKYFDEED